MNRYLVTLDNRELEVTLTNRQGSQLSFEVSGKSYTAHVSPILTPTALVSATQGYTAPVTQQKNVPVARGSGSVVAPMPGIVANVLVKEGAKVELGQAILVIEAMKMENNIQATKTGTIKKLHCKKGDEVQNAQLLVTIE